MLNASAIGAVHNVCRVSLKRLELSRKNCGHRGEVFMLCVRTITLLSGIIAAAIAWPEVELLAQAAADPNGAPNPYRLDANWLKMPDGRKMGQVTGVDIAPDGKSVWVFERCGARDCVNSTLNPVDRFDASGNFVLGFGQGLFNHPHGFYVDREGNVWATDNTGGNGKGHQVIKLSPEGKVLLTLGKGGVAGDGPDMFNAPTDVAVAANGDIIVSDGHGGNTNARIVKFTSSGKFITAWGRRGSGPGEFGVNHSLAIDAAGRIFVADRSNNRIEIFSPDGVFLAEWKQFGRPSGLFIDKNDVLYVTDSESNMAQNPGFKRGVRIGSVKDGKVTAFIPELAPPKEGTGAASNSWGECVAADDAGNVFVGMYDAGTVARYVKQ
jgi:6-bladed beta-propeller